MTHVDWHLFPKERDKVKPGKYYFVTFEDGDVTVTRAMRPSYGYHDEFGGCLGDIVAFSEIELPEPYNRRQRMSKATIKRIFKHYGEQSQLMKTQEELKELDEAISLLLTLEMGTIEKKSAVYKSNRDNLIDHIAEELADVRIMLDQIAFGLGIEKSCAEWRELKINRQLKRMEME